MKTQIVSIMAGCFCAICFCPTRTEATLITIEVEGVVDDVYDPYGYLEGKIEVGTIIEGIYTYDPSVSRLPGHQYEFSFPCGVSLIAGGFKFETDPTRVDFAIGIGNNVSEGDGYFFISYRNIPLSAEVPVGGISWTLEDSTGKALLSDALATTAPVLEDWGFNRLNIGGGTRARPFGFLGHVTSAEVIPEPSTILFLCLGSLILRKRRYP